jgi:precorrin-6B methylase 1
VQQQLQAATSSLERIDAVGGVETVLQLVQDAGKHETAAAEAKQRVAAMEEVVHSAKEVRPLPVTAVTTTFSPTPVVSHV